MNFDPRTFFLRLTPVLALLATGCASTYHLTLMPRTSGQLYYGQAVEQAADGQAMVSIHIGEKTYRGTWVPVSAGRTLSNVSGGFGWAGGRRGSLAVGVAPVVIDNPEGASAKALLQAGDGSGLRCDIRGLGSGASAGGSCQDDAGLIYDVQIRLVRP